jgi:hypothetical protein
VFLQDLHRGIIEVTAHFSGFCCFYYYDFFLDDVFLNDFLLSNAPQGRSFPPGVLGVIPDTSFGDEIAIETWPHLSTDITKISRWKSLNTSS